MTRSEYPVEVLSFKPYQTHVVQSVMVINNFIGFKLITWSYIIFYNRNASIVHNLVTCAFLTHCILNYGGAFLWQIE